jgi:predicted GNAT family acetyltransferase
LGSPTRSRCRAWPSNRMSATPGEHRGRGYGAALTAAAAQGGFASGADLAWLQSSAMGLSVYRRLGFREVERYVLLTRPEAA